MPFRGGGVHPIGIGQTLAVPDHQNLASEGNAKRVQPANYGHTADAWYKNMIRRCSSWFGQNRSFVFGPLDPQYDAQFFILAKTR